MKRAKRVLGLGVGRGLKARRVVVRDTAPPAPEPEPARTGREIDLSLEWMKVDSLKEGSEGAVIYGCNPEGIEVPVSYDYSRNQQVYGRFPAISRDVTSRLPLRVWLEEVKKFEGRFVDLHTRRIDAQAAHFAPMQPTLGADPEVFVVANDQPMRVIPAWEVFPVEQTVPISSYMSDGAGGTKPTTYPDGFGVEFSVYSPYCQAWFVDRFAASLYHIQQRAAKMGGHITLRDCMPISLGDIAPEHLQLGCSPSLNAYGDVPVMPDGGTLPWRTIGMHLHYGFAHFGGYWTPRYMKEFNAKHPEYINYIVRLMDIGALVALALTPTLQSAQRRTLYGRAGEYRVDLDKIWKLEYRTHSSAVMYHPVLTHIVCEITRALFNIGAAMPFGVRLPKPEVMQEAINGCDARLARAILKDYKWVVYGALRQRAIRDTDAVTARAWRWIEASEGLEGAYDLTDKALNNNWHFDELDLTGKPKVPEALKIHWVGHCGSQEACIAHAGALAAKKDPDAKSVEAASYPRKVEGERTYIVKEV